MLTEDYDFGFLNDLTESLIKTNKELLAAVGVRMDGQKLRDVSELAIEKDRVVC